MKIGSLCIFTGLLLAATFGLARAQQQTTIERISQIAANSSCAATDWKNRGRAPKAYMRGLAIVFARAICQPNRNDVKIVSAARGEPNSNAKKTDALTWYDGVFSDLGMSNATAGVDTLRHAYTLLAGLGMRESSGQHCVGRDRSANFTTADSAEAGLFQTSHGARRFNIELSNFYASYKAAQGNCLLEVFKRGVSCSAWDARTWGEGEGATWQRLTKACPAFATEYAAVLIRIHGGNEGEFGPIRRRKAEVIPSCDTMFSEVQNLVQSNPNACSELQLP